MYGAYGVLAALLERSRTGRGPVVRTSLLAAIVGVHAFQGTRFTVAGEVGRAAGNHHPSICPYGLFHCRDGVVQIAVGSEGLWRRFAPEFGLDPAAPGMATNTERVHHRDEVIAAIDGAFAAPRRRALLARLAELGIPAGRVRDARRGLRLGADPRQGLLVEVEHATLGPITLPGPPLRFSTARRRRTQATPAARRCWTPTVPLVRQLARLSAHARDRPDEGDSAVRRPDRP